MMDKIRKLAARVGAKSVGYVPSFSPRKQAYITVHGDGIARCFCFRPDLSEDELPALEADIRSLVAALAAFDVRWGVRWAP